LFHGRIVATTLVRFALCARRFQSRKPRGILRELLRSAEHFNDTELWRFVMRMFFITVGILSWMLALGVLWIFAESGGALTVIAAGVFAGVAIVALGVERVLKVLEEIRDRGTADITVSKPPVGKVERVEVREREVTTPTGAVPI
jgi:hypothetical protein